MILLQVFKKVFNPALEMAELPSSCKSLMNCETNSKLELHTHKLLLVAIAQPATHSCEQISEHERPRGQTSLHKT